MSSRLKVSSKVRSLWEKHKRWKNCQECDLCLTRDKVVLARGHVPAPVTLIGEAPGQSEDDSGFPFEGEAGYHLNEWLEVLYAADIRFNIANIIACWPTDEDGNTIQPPKESIKACRQRLREFLHIAKPKIVISLGKVAKSHIPKSTKYQQLDIIHPSAVLRMKGRRATIADKGAMDMLRLAVKLLREST